MRLFLIFSALLITNYLAAQVSDFGQWIHVGNVIEGPTHFAPPPPFPPATNKDGEVTVTYSAKEKEKLKKLLELFKEVYPKPKYHSYVIQLDNWCNKTQAEVASRNYRFGYQLTIHPEKMWVENGKIINKKMQFVNMDATIRNSVSPLMSVLVNYLPPNTSFGNFTDCPTIDHETTLTYKDTFRFTNNVKEDKYYRYANKQYIISLLNTEYSFIEAKQLNPSANYPSYAFNNEGDKFVVLRKIEANNLKNYYGKMKFWKDDKTIEFKTYNTVILSHNGKLPITPITIKDLLDIQLQEYEYDVKYWNQSKNREITTEDFTRNKKRIDENYARIFKELDIRKKNIDLIYKHCQNKLNQPAIVNRAYDETFQNVTLGEGRDGIYNELLGKTEEFNNTILESIFVSDPKLGRSFYKIDRDFYKNLSDGEIRTIALSWIDKTRLADSPDYKKSNTLLNDRISEIDYTDNPDYYLNYFYKNFDWKKLQALLGK